MITSVELAIYCFLKEIGVCDRAKEAFYPEAGMDREDLSRVINWADLEVPDFVLDVMWKWVDLKELRRASLEVLVELAYLYENGPHVDNTFRTRFHTLLLGEDGDCGLIPF